MRILFTSPTHAMRCAKNLSRLLRAEGISVTLGACRGAVATMCGYSGWHEFERNCTREEATAWDHLVDAEERESRRRRQVEVLVDRFGLRPDAAAAIVAAVRPSGHLKAEAPIGWIKIPGGGARFVEGIYSHVVAPLRLTRSRKIVDDAVFEILISRGTEDPQSVKIDRHFGSHVAGSMAEAVAMAETEIRALRVLDRRVADGRVSLASGFTDDGTVTKRLRLSAEWIDRLPPVYRMPVGASGTAEYGDGQEVLVVSSLPSMFTPFEIDDYSHAEEAFPRLHAIASGKRPATAHEMLRAGLGMWEPGWDYSSMLRMTRCGRPDADDVVRVVYEFEEFWGPNNVFDPGEGDRLTMKVPASELDSDGFALDFDRHEIVAFERRPKAAAEDGSG